MFIDVGHYVRDLAAYEELQTVVSLYTVREQLQICLFGWLRLETAAFLDSPK